MADVKNPDMLAILTGTDSWKETANATNATATATHAAATDKQHGIHTIIIDYDDAAADRAVVVKFGGVEQFQFNVKDKRILNLPFVLRAGTNEAVDIEIPAGGAAIVGRVTVIGFTVDV